MSFAQNYHKWILSEFSPFLGSSIAEIGAGAGNFSRLLLDMEIQSLAAFEPSHNMFPLLHDAVKQDSRATAINGFFEAEACPSRFDSILYVNVLEHIESESRELANAYAGLQPGGYLLLFVPALPWLFSEFDRNVGHHRRYNKKPLIHLVSSAGFMPIKTIYFDIAGILPWYVNFTLMKNSMSASSVSVYDRLVVPIMKQLESFYSPPIGKNLLMIAQKS